jgi:L-fuculose-phosphate aldolase
MGLEADIEVGERYAAALDGIEERKRLLVICWLHLAGRDRLTIHPRGDVTQPEKGVFATRSPVRPNPVAVYTVELLGVEGRRLRVRGLDAVDGTPVIDIRPHISRLDD